MTTADSVQSFASEFPKLDAALAVYGVTTEAMAKSFPRLLKSIDTGWGAANCLHYIDGLLFSDRTSRFGFPNEVIDELLLIKNILEDNFPIASVNRHDPFSKIHAAEIHDRIEALAALVKQRTKKAITDDAEEPKPPKAGIATAKPGEALTIAALQKSLSLLEKGPLLGHKEHRLIGEYLIETGILDQEKLNRALNYQAKAPIRHLLGELLVSEATIKPHQLNRALCLQRGIPIVDAASIEISAEAVHLVPVRIARLKGAMPITMYGQQLVVAVANPFDQELQEYFSFLSGNRVLLVFSTLDRIVIAQASYGQFSAGETVHKNQAGVTRKTTLATSDEENLAKSLATSTAGQTEPDESIEETEETEEAEDTTNLYAQSSIDENDETVIGLVNKTVNDAIRVGASDIHFEVFPRTQNAQIRFRKDGLMEAHSAYPIAYHAAVVSRLKIMSELDISEKRKAQDGKVTFGVGNKKLDLRVSTIPTSNNLEVVTVRILSSGRPLPLSKIGMHPTTLAEFKRLIAIPHGLIIVCGPTGSGKTTTLHSVLRELNTPERKIWTAEDPVEVVQKNISQVQVLPKIGWTFSKALRSFLRADPDVIMVGEIRDAETAKVAVEASMTGHMVFSTLHTNSAAETLARLLDLEVQAFNLADATQAILAQRLARRICPECGESFEFSAEELETLVAEYFLAGTGKIPSKADRDKLLGRWHAEFVGDGPLMGRRAMGCSACNGSGYRGRLGIHELLVVTPELRQLIRSGASTGDIYRQAIKDGMKTLRQDGIEKSVQGLTDLKEIRMVCL